MAQSAELGAAMGRTRLASPPGYPQSGGKTLGIGARLYTSPFQPSFKLKQKIHIGARVSSAAPRQSEQLEFSRIRPLLRPSGLTQT